MTSDAKAAGNTLVLVGETHDDPVPTVRDSAPQIMRDVAAAIRSGTVRACHDLSEGGLAVAATEMAIGGGLGVRLRTDVDLFNESPSRFLLEVDGELDIGTPVGEVIAEPVVDLGTFEVTLEEARAAFFHWEQIL